MDTSLLLIAAFCGIWQFVSTTDFGYTLSDTLGQPVLVGALLGLLTGQVEQGLMIGGSLELMYLGIIYPGGTVRNPDRRSLRHSYPLNCFLH